MDCFNKIYLFSNFFPQPNLIHKVVIIKQKAMLKIKDKTVLFLNNIEDCLRSIDFCNGDFFFNVTNYIS